MAKTRDIKRRIKSVQSTQQITRTMEMVATSKLKRAQNRLTSSRPYGGEVKSFIQDLATSLPGIPHPLLKRRGEEHSIALFLLTSNRGLCGAFNTNLIKMAQSLYEELKGAGKEITLYISGKKGLAFFKFRGFSIESEYTALPELPSPSDVAEIADRFISLYASGRIDKLVLIYNHFRSPVEQRPVIETVLPIPFEMPEKQQADYIIEPVGEEILDRLLPLYVHSALRMALVESTTSEQGARRTAMKSATDNAEEMITYLIRSFNKARQAQITQEIAEIVGGVNALID
ncbi:MAG: ATP synthase F1 subunit gamma [Candidatus Glassbacteria bacterium]